MNSRIKFINKILEYEAHKTFDGQKEMSGKEFLNFMIPNKTPKKERKFHRDLVILHTLKYISFSRIEGSENLDVEATAAGIKYIENIEEKNAERRYNILLSLGSLILGAAISIITALLLQG